MQQVSNCCIRLTVYSLSYLNESANLVRYATTFPLSIFKSIFVTSATRKSRKLLDAVSTAFLAASSQETLLVPTSSITLYTLSLIRYLLPVVFYGLMPILRHLFVQQPNNFFNQSLLDDYNAGAAFVNVNLEENAVV